MKIPIVEPTPRFHAPPHDSECDPARKSGTALAVKDSAASAFAGGHRFYARLANPAWPAIEQCHKPTLGIAHGPETTIGPHAERFQAGFRQNPPLNPFPGPELQ